MSFGGGKADRLGDAPESSGDVIGIRMVFLGAAGVVVAAAGVAFFMFCGESGRASVTPSVRAPEAT
jgi:hypothetical protein